MDFKNIKVVMEWVVKGSIPKRVSKNGHKAETSLLDTLSIFNLLKITKFSDSEVDQILKILKERSFIVTAVKTESKTSNEVDISSPHDRN